MMVRRISVFEGDVLASVACIDPEAQEEMNAIRMKRSVIALVRLAGWPAYIFRLSLLQPWSNVEIVFTL